jgi:hypothetical protein
MLRVKLILIGLICLAASASLYAAYLVFAREIRIYMFQDPKCLSAWINAAIDNLFELSVLGSAFLVLSSTSRWLVIPWLFVYAIDIVVLIGLAFATLLVPVNNPNFPGKICFSLFSFLEITCCLFLPDWFDSRQVFFPVLALFLLLLGMWSVVAMEYGKWKRTGSEAAAAAAVAAAAVAPGNVGRKVRMTVNICCGLLALLSSVMLVVIHSNLYTVIANFIADKVWDVPNDLLKVRIDITLATKKKV